MRDPIINNLQNMSATINGIVVPAGSILSAIRRHTLVAWVHNEKVGWSVSPRGSATAIRFKGRDLLVCTQHQLKGEDHSKVCMMADEGRTIVTAGALHYPTLSDETDAFDLSVFDFTEPVSKAPQFRGRFYNLSGRRPPAGEVLAVIVVGYAFADQEFEGVATDDDYVLNHVTAGRRAVVCLPMRTPTSDEAIVEAVAQEPLEIEPNGFSGGSAYILYYAGSEFGVDFAGVVAQGSNNIFRIIRAGVVLDILERATAFHG